jgi:hypothetical protein
VTLEKHALTIEELEAERAVELPKRDAMSGFLNLNIAPVVQVGVALALNVLSFNSSATAAVYQFVNIGQSNH